MSLPTLASGCLAHGHLSRGCRLLIQTPTLPGDRESPKDRNLAVSHLLEAPALVTTPAQYIVGSREGSGKPIDLCFSQAPLGHQCNPAWLKERERISSCHRRSPRLVEPQVLLDAGFRRHLEDSVPSLSIGFCRRVVVSDFSP